MEMNVTPPKKFSLFKGKNLFTSTDLELRN